MFESLSERLSAALAPLSRKGLLTESDVAESLRVVRRALLEADVALPVLRDFIARVEKQAVGARVLRSVSPGAQIVKIVHDELVRVLAGAHASGDGTSPLSFGPPPSAVLMVGLQGSGKTTTSAKLARKLREEGRRKPLLVSLDTSRPAAMEQLAILAAQCSLESLPAVPGETPRAIAERALRHARLGRHDVILLDTAGRMHADDAAMQEARAVSEAVRPSETLLVADALTGQDAVSLAEQFDRHIGLTGIILTRMDGDGRGGAALSMRAVTGKPIKYIGVGEKLEALEPFHPERVAGRILGMGDVVSLVEKAQEAVEEEEAARLMRKVRRGRFDMNDLRGHLERMHKLGGFSAVAAMLPGMGKLARQMEERGFDDRALQRQLAIISSMTAEERKRPEIMHARRKRRVAAGAGVDVQMVNQLLKTQRQLADVMKKMSRAGGVKAMMRGPLGAFLGARGDSPSMPVGTGSGIAPAARHFSSFGAGKRK